MYVMEIRTSPNEEKEEKGNYGFRIRSTFTRDESNSAQSWNRSSVARLCNCSSSETTTWPTRKYSII